MEEKGIKAVVVISKDDQRTIQALAKKNGIRVSKWYSDAIKEKITHDREKE